MFKEKESPPHRGADLVYRKYREDLKFLSRNLPARRVTLKELLENSISGIELRDGGIHRLDPAELERMADTVPWYLHPVTRIPLIIEYTTVDEKRVFRVRGDRWDRRIVEVLLTGKFGVDGVEFLEYNDVARLVALYKSLILIILSV